MIYLLFFNISAVFAISCDIVFAIPISDPPVGELFHAIYPGIPVLFFFFSFFFFFFLFLSFLSASTSHSLFQSLILSISQSLILKKQS